MVRIWHILAAVAVVAALAALARSTLGLVGLGAIAGLVVGFAGYWWAEGALHRPGPGLSEARFAAIFVVRAASIVAMTAAAILGWFAFAAALGLAALGR